MDDRPLLIKIDASNRNDGAITYAITRRTPRKTPFRIARLTASLPNRIDEQAEAKTVISATFGQASQWGWKPCPVVVVEHDDGLRLPKLLTRSAKGTSPVFPGDGERKQVGYLIAFANKGELE
ncbi:hypothetical protein Pla52o_27490 [Novipirellula galeiformis]|uniref:Uncharacterized protein n=1 Tax=Novipirellula galeiformis TaxID=2528004 RepID=A0A5C6CE92_9BACT|nr:hypothetical protein Pla52o_27490 [Novipirellula galeiformis]